MTERETTTYTAEQIEAIGGRRWAKTDGTLRVYINEDVWAALIGLRVERYRTGNISSAHLRGERISNSRAGRALTTTKVYWQDGKIWITKDAELAADIRAAIAQAVAALTSDDDEPTDGGQGDTAGTVNRLRQAGRTVREIAEMVGVSASTIYRWARGVCSPRPTNAAALAALA